MAIVTYELRDAVGTAFAILKVDTTEETWLDAKGDESILSESQGTARKSDGTLGIYCDSDNGNVVQLINADWSDGPPNNHEGRCRRCDVGCESEPRWHCTARE